jgi:dTDP-4-dehydrorhamnose 3,5-epimerase
MDIEELGIKGAWIARSPVHHDDRGYFREWFKHDDLVTETGVDFQSQQGNFSYSDKGVLRGIHYSSAPEGQSKWITCMSGAIWDVVIDIRPESATFKKWVGVELTELNGEAIFISGGLGHAFIALEEKTLVSYLLSSNYSPQEEFTISPFDPELGIIWPNMDFKLSERDLEAPTLAQQIIMGNLGLLS